MKRNHFGFLTITIIYGLIFIFSESLLGKTPVNLLGLGSHEVGSNLLVNLLWYSIASFMIFVLIGFFIKNKINWIDWITQGILGFLFAVIATVVVIVFWYTYTVKQEFNPLP